MKIKELLKNVFRSKIGRIVCLSILGIMIIFVVLLVNYNAAAEVDTEFLITKLTKASELTTAKLEYTGFSKFKDNGIPIINRSDFLMVYTANARAGIDVKDVKIETDKISKTIWISIPKAKILSVNVDPKKITYYDEKFSLFNVNQKEDSDKAQALAEEEAKKELAKMGILKMADEQAETLIKGLLLDSIPEGYTLKVKKSK